MRYNLRNNNIPLLTTKKMAYKTCLRELLWFIKGETNNKLLKKQNVNIWNDNSSRSFLDSRGLYDYEEDELGPIYGFQWRNFNGTYNTGSKKEDINNGIDQLKLVIDSLNNKGDVYMNNEGLMVENIYSRRLIVSAWNPCQLDMMALPPCHVLYQFYVNGKNELSCSLYQRSGDVGLGVPFNIASYSILTHLIAKHTGLKTGDFIHTIGDAHIYEEHKESLIQQLSRKPYKSPLLYIAKKKENIEDYIETDFILKRYKYYDKISMNMK